MASTATFTATFAANGTYTWVAPAGVTSVSVQCWAGGASGNSGANNSDQGGGGGEYAAELTNTVVAGDSYTVVVGAAGGAANSAAGNAGGASSFTGTSATTVTANGGTATAGGSGSTNTVHHNGGAGGTGSLNSYGGGGGGSGGTSAAGNTGSNGSGSTGGAGATAVTGGGPGGAGGSGSGAGNAPVSGPGGGGGGSGGSTFSGAGFAGQVVITWTMSSPATLTANTSGSTSTWTAPTGVTSVSVQCWGAGGGGQGGSSGAGGGGGEYAAELTNTVVPGDLYTFAVGAAGTAGGGGGGAGGNGGNSTFSGTSATTVTANGGTGSSGSGGAGGSGSTNSVHHSGGTGGALGSPDGGGGGGSGGTAAAGNNGTAGASGGAGASAVTGGGPGGNGGTSANGSAPASGPGGGGGGAGSGSNGGAGFAGQLVLTWSATGGVGGSPQKGSRRYGQFFRRTQTTPLLITPIASTGSVALGPLATSGTSAESLFQGGSVQPGGRQWRRKFRRRQVTPLAPPAQIGSMALGPLVMQATGTVTENVFPFQPLGVKLELLVNGTWTNITSYVYQRDMIVITRGRADETQQAQPGQMTLTLNNRDGNFTPKCQNGIFYPYIQRNIQMRLSVLAVSATSQLYQGYRFWGEVSSWPPKWDPTGNDVYASITVSGVFRRMTQGAKIGSALDRYYRGLAAPVAPIAWWPCEDGSGATQLASGLPSGGAMTFTGTPSLAADSQFGGTDPVLELNGAVLTGSTAAYGASGDDLFIAPGTFTWTCPAGVTVADVKCIAGGGGSGAGTSSQGGGGGGGGEYAEEPAYSVTPGTGYSVVVGQGGAAGANGGNSSFNAFVVANGGQGASSVFGANGGTGSSNTTHNNGGAGASTSAGSGGNTFNFNQTFYSSSTWTAPTGVNSPVTVASLGGGGGGQGGVSGGGRPAGGGGGWRQLTQSVSAGTGYTVTVGGGGSGGSGGGGAGGNGGNSTFNGAVTGGGGTGAAGNTPGSGGGGGNAGGNGGAGSLTSPGGGGGGGGSGSASGTGPNGGSANFGTGGVGKGGGGGGGNGGGGTGANGKNASGYGGGGGGGGNGAVGGTGGNGKGGWVNVQGSYTTSGSAGSTGGGGGGGSGSSGGAGGAGSVTAGGTGTGMGGAGGVSNPGSPGNTPGGGAGGGDGSASGTFAGAAGGAGQVEIVYTPPTVPNTNVIRFLFQTPAGGGTDASTVCQVTTGGTVHSLILTYNTASSGSLTMTGKNAGGSTLFTSGVITGVNALPLYVSMELVNSGANISYALRAIKPGATSDFSDQTGTLNSAACGNVSAVVINNGGTETTAVAIGQITVQYALVALSTLGAVAGGFAGELAGDRFIRLCGEYGVTALLKGDSYTDFEDGTDGWTSKTSDTLTQYSGWASTGLYSLLVTSAGNATTNAASPATYAVTPGDIVSAYADVKAISTLNALTISIDWYSSLNLLLSSSGSTAVMLTAGGVTTVSVTGQTAPASAVTAAVRVWDNEALSAGRQYATDNVTMFKNSQMGPQQDDTMMNVLQSIEDLDRGLLFEPRASFGAGYRTRKSLQNQSPGLTLDYSLAQLGANPMLAPTYDDQLIRNYISVTRSGGSTVTVADTTDTMSTANPPAGVGLYTYSLSVVAYADSQLANLANWLLTLGTVDQERYPQVSVDLSRSEVASLMSNSANLDAGAFFNVINPPVFLPQTEIDQLAYGFTETISAYIWTIAMNAVPESPYASGSLPDW